MDEKELKDIIVKADFMFSESEEEDWSTAYARLSKAAMILLILTERAANK